MQLTDRECEILGELIQGFLNQAANFNTIAGPHLPTVDREGLKAVMEEVQALQTKICRHGFQARVGQTGPEFEEPHVIIDGNLTEGFRVIGPFEDFDIAASADVGGGNWITRIYSPEEYKTMLAKDSEKTLDQPGFKIESDDDQSTYFAH